MLPVEEQCPYKLYDRDPEPHLWCVYLHLRPLSLLTLSLDVSALPSSAPRLLLSAPTQATPVFLGIGLACSIIFFITFTLISFRHKMGDKMTTMLDNPIVQRLSAWIGFFGFMIGRFILQK
jgi:hypothetical protein